MKFIVALWITLGGGMALACSVHPGLPILFKNRLVAEIANKYYADLSQTSVKIIDHKHLFDWRFTDSGYMCHDTNYVSLHVELQYLNVFTKKVCTVEVQANEVSGPKTKGGPVEVDRDIKEIRPSDCQ